MVCLKFPRRQHTRRTRIDVELETWTDTPTTALSFVSNFENLIVRVEPRGIFNSKELASRMPFAINRASSNGKDPPDEGEVWNWRLLLVVVDERRWRCLRAARRRDEGVEVRDGAIRATSSRFADK